MVIAGPLNFIEVAHILNRFSTHGDMHRALLEGVSKRRLLPPEQVLNTLNNQLLKANRLVGDPNFVRRQAPPQYPPPHSLLCYRSPLFPHSRKDNCPDIIRRHTFVILLGKMVLSNLLCFVEAHEAIVQVEPIFAFWFLIEKLFSKLTLRIEKIWSRIDWVFS